MYAALADGSGLVRSRKVGRVRTCRLEPAAVQAAEHWSLAQA